MLSKTRRSDKRRRLHAVASKIPLSWERELAAQEQCRVRIAEAQRSLSWWQRQVKEIHEKGGKGWVNRIGHAHLMVERAWRTLRAELSALWARKSPI